MLKLSDLLVVVDHVYMGPCLCPRKVWVSAVAPEENNVINSDVNPRVGHVITIDRLVIDEGIPLKSEHIYPGQTRSADLSDSAVVPISVGRVSRPELKPPDRANGWLGDWSSRLGNDGLRPVLRDRWKARWRRPTFKCWCRGW